MSYILDAIKKADQKRKLGSVPDVNTVHEVPVVEARRPGLLYVLAIFLLLNAVGIGWWLWPGGEEQGPRPQSAKGEQPVQGLAAGPEGELATAGTATILSRESASAAPGPGMSEPQMPPMPGQAIPQSAPVAKVPPPVPDPPAVAPARQAAPLPQPPSAAPVRTAAPPMPGAPQAVAATPPPPAKAEAAGSAPVVPVLTPTPPPETVQDEFLDSDEMDEGERGEVAAEETDGAVESAEREVMAPIASAPPPKDKGKRRSRREEEDPALAKIPFLKQLPEEMQQGLPDLHISFHAYSIKAKSRLVSIGGKVLREGQELEEGVKLETITNKGVVIVANGQRFRLNVQ